MIADKYTPAARDTWPDQYREIRCLDCQHFNKVLSIVAAYRHTPKEKEKDSNNCTSRQKNKCFQERIYTAKQEEGYDNFRMLVWFARYCLRLGHLELEELFEKDHPTLYRIANAMDERISGIPRVKRQVQKKYLCPACKTYGPHKDGRCLFCGEARSKDKSA